LNLVRGHVRPECHVLIIYLSGVYLGGSGALTSDNVGLIAPDKGSIAVDLHGGYVLGHRLHGGLFNPSGLVEGVQQEGERTNKVGLHSTAKLGLTHHPAPS